LAEGWLVTFWTYERLGGKFNTYGDLTKYLGFMMPVLLFEFMFALGVTILATLYLIGAFIFKADHNDISEAPWVFGGIGFFDLLFFSFVLLSRWVNVEIKTIKAKAAKIETGTSDLLGLSASEIRESR
jgi:hypothetical protein